MDVLDQLESRLEALLRTAAELGAENRRLKDEMDRQCAAIREENQRLREDLERERALKDAVLARIDELLKKLVAASA